MVVRKNRWTVTVNKPRANDGPNWILRPRAPTGVPWPPNLPRRKSSKTTDRGLAE